jgi:hypothetical protein
MSADVCPITRLRCTTPLPCAAIHCSADRTLKPISETRLSKAEQYALAMAEQKVGT